MNIEEKIREEAAKVLFNSFSKGELPPSYGDVDIYFKQGYLLGIKEAFRWIPVGERLPEKGKKVLVLWDNSAGRYDQKLRIGVFHSRGWVNLDGEIFDTATRGVTHWRPINLEDL